MAEHRRAVQVWSGAVCVAAAALAGFLQHFRWLFILAVAIGALAFVILLASGVPDLVGWVKEQRDELVRRRIVRGPAFMERRRRTTEGKEAGGLVHTLQKRLDHPGYQHPPGAEPPAVRIGLRVACDALAETPSTSELRAVFLEFLNQAPIRDLIAQLTDVGGDLTWRSYGGNGRFTNGAVLVADDEDKAPVASALMNLKEADTRRWGHEEPCAELLVYVKPRNGSGNPAPPAGLAAWHDRLVTALEVPGAFARFLTAQLGVRTYPHPPTRLGVRLDARPSITELVDTSGLVPVGGSSASPSFQHYLIAERVGQLPEEVAIDCCRSGAITPFASRATTVSWRGCDVGRHRAPERGSEETLSPPSLHGRSVPSTAGTVIARAERIGRGDRQRPSAFLGPLPPCAPPPPKSGSSKISGSGGVVQLTTKAATSSAKRQRSRVTSER
jgi:hypothetical protein